MLSPDFMQHELSFNSITADQIFTLPDSINHTGHEKGITVSVLRLDKIHPLISGNKWFKLRLYIEEAMRSGKKAILTFGGAWSNHILATAAICKLNNISSIGIIRGEQAPVLSPTLTMARQMGMQLIFSSRQDYQQKKLDPSLISDDIYVIDEGGYGSTGAKGASTILDFSSRDYTHYCCAVGTGTMLAGLINAALPGQQVVGFSVLKGNHELHEKISLLVERSDIPWHLQQDYHFGGYAKHQPDLISFMNEWYRQTKIPSDFVYTGKLFYGVADLIKKDFFAPGSRILIIHSGGLQGNQSLNKGTLMF